MSLPNLAPLSFLLLAAVLTGGPLVVEVEHPRDPGVEREASNREADRLLALAQCGACHALSSEANGLAPRALAPDLTGVDERLGRAEVRAFLRNPHTERPRTRMPDLLAALPAGEREAAVEALGAYLVPTDTVTPTAPAALDLQAVERGRQLYHSVGCVACHGAFDEVDALDTPLVAFEELLAVPEFARALRDVDPAAVWEHAPPLDLVGSSRSVDALAGFLQDPLAVRPYGSMPDLGLEEGEARELAEYLRFEAALREGRVEEGTVAGLSYQYFEGDFHEEGPPAFDRLEPARDGVVTALGTLPPHRENQFGFRYRGQVDVPRAGLWTFATASDDGSWLWIDGAPVVANGGTHPIQEARGQIRLEAGLHDIEVRYFEAGGGQGLDVRWEGPGVALQTIPASALSTRGLTVSASSDAAPSAAEEALRERGAELFESLGCVSCHATADRPEPRAATVDPWSTAAAALGEGCLSEAPGAGLARYPAGMVADGGPLRRAAVVAAEGGLALDAAGVAHSTLTTMRCTACHAREGVGAPDDALARYFRAEEGVDLGDEGRLPPELDHVGWKLRDEWALQVLADGTKVRPYMHTRMPRFGLENVGHLVDAFRTLDRPREEPAPPGFTKQAVEHGKLLMGTDGLGCVQCHDLAGYEGLGVPAVDLATSHQRLRWPWFRALLADPGALNMNTRMPSFWTQDGRSPVDELYGADPERQVEAIWTFLSLGDAAPLPKGLVVPEGAYELTPLEEPIAVMVFWEGASARTVLVGYPERLHVAFDVENARLDAAWRGRFFDARGTWHARAGALERPPTDDVLQLPPGPALAGFEGEDTPWPDAVGRAAGWRAVGRTLDAERVPTFAYRNDALGVRVRERAVPTLGDGGVRLVRELEVTSEASGPPLWMRAAVAREVRAEGDGDFVTSDGQRLAPEGVDGWVRKASTGDELVLSVPRGDTVSFRIEMTWTRPSEATR